MRIRIRVRNPGISIVQRPFWPDLSSRSPIYVHTEADMFLSQICSIDIHNFFASGIELTDKQLAEGKDRRAEENGQFGC